MKHVPRFYMGVDPEEGEEIFLSFEQAHHAINVLRLSAGDVVRIFNSREEWNCEIVDVKKRSLKRVSLFRKSKPEKGPAIACSLINPKRFDFLLEKVTELGASEIIPIISQYAQYKDLNLRKAEQKIIQACEQCGRFSVPLLKKTTKLEDFLLKCSIDCKILVGDEKFSGSKLEDIMEEKSVFLVGPEGGFSDEEYNLFDACKNLRKFSIGTNILKSETAAIAFVSVWSCRFS
jgi:16S rRNA (uracil1498-N3)-methyltransferase